MDDLVNILIGEVPDWHILRRGLSGHDPLSLSHKDAYNLGWREGRRLLIRAILHRLRLLCRDCDGSGEIHSHNPKCPSCDGKGYLT